MKIGIFTDSHCSDKEITCTTRRPSLSMGKIREAMEYFVSKDVEVILCLGDLTDYCVNKCDDKRMLEEAVGLIASYSLPFYCLRGNHDADAFTKEEFYSVKGITEPPFTLAGSHSIAVFLDACYNRDGSPYKKGEVDWENTAVSQEQIEKLKNTLAENETSDITVFIHQNISDVPHKSHIIANAQEVRALLSSHNGRVCVYEGHYHHGYSTNIDGVQYTTLKAMCEGEENSFAVVII